MSRIDTHIDLRSAWEATDHFADRFLVAWVAKHEPCSQLARIRLSRELIAVEDHKPTVLAGRQELVTLYRCPDGCPRARTASPYNLAEGPDNFAVAEHRPNGIQFHHTTLSPTEKADAKVLDSLAGRLARRIVLCGCSNARAAVLVHPLVEHTVFHVKVASSTATLRVCGTDTLEGKVRETFRALRWPWLQLPEAPAAIGDFLAEQ